MPLFAVYIAVNLVIDHRALKRLKAEIVAEDERFNELLVELKDQKK